MCIYVHSFFMFQVCSHILES